MAAELSHPTAVQYDCNGHYAYGAVPAEPAGYGDSDFGDQLRSHRHS